MNGDGAFAFSKYWAQTPRADCCARMKLDEVTSPAHSVQVPGAEQVHRKTLGVGCAVGARASEEPGAGTSEGSAPIVEKGRG